MLVITRRDGEEVVIGDPSNPTGVVRIASIKGDRVRLAFATSDIASPATVSTGACLDVPDRRQYSAATF